jgi:methylmalonyl-CoA/ethylmalonyl-CoA epimerase
MMAMQKPLFTETLQICVVVRDLEASLKTYVENYGIGPWEIYDFDSDTVENLEKDGQPADMAFRIAVTMVGSVQWELIQPLDDRSIYAEFLAEKGEGLHHVAVGVEGYREAVQAMEGNGRRVLQSGYYQGATFAYLSTDEDLGVITEVYDWPPDLPKQEPDAVYP